MLSGWNTLTSEKWKSKLGPGPEPAWPLHAYLGHCTNQGHLSADPWAWLQIQACHTDTNTATVNPTTKPVLAIDSPTICAVVTHTHTTGSVFKKIYIMFYIPILCNKPSHPPCGHLNFKTNTFYIHVRFFNRDFCLTCFAYGCVFLLNLTIQSLFGRLNR